MFLFVVLAMVVFHYAFTVPGGGDLSFYTGGMLWVVFVFGALLGLNRSFAHEKDEGCLDGLLLCPVDRVTIFLAKMTANLIFLGLIQVLAVPVFALFFASGRMATHLPAFLALVVLADLGIAALGTLLATIAMHTRARDLLLPILFLPLVIPLLIAAASGTSAVLVGRGRLGVGARQARVPAGIRWRLPGAGLRHLRRRDRRVERCRAPRLPPPRPAPVRRSPGSPRPPRSSPPPAWRWSPACSWASGSRRPTPRPWASPRRSSTFTRPSPRPPCWPTAWPSWPPCSTCAAAMPATTGSGVAAVRLGLLFSLLVMVTGTIWGRAAWGVWWAWEPRLTTFLIACLLYSAYFVLRGAVEDESRRATYAALFAIVAFVDVPITFFATRFLPAGLHPVVLGPSGSGMDYRDLIAFLISMAGMTLLFVGLLRLELGIEALREELRELKYRLGR